MLSEKLGSRSVKSQQCLTLSEENRQCCVTQPALFDRTSENLPRIQLTGLQLTLDIERPACERHGDLEPAYRSRSIHSPTPLSLPIIHTALDEAETSGEEKRGRRVRLCLAALVGVSKQNKVNGFRRALGYKALVYEHKGAVVRTTLDKHGIEASIRLTGIAAF
ncbi:hypothetical protein SRHO_G00234640 [Serrasalmus rhombeus]